jgi:hypothetical protein
MLASSSNIGIGLISHKSRQYLILFEPRTGMIFCYWTIMIMYCPNFILCSKFCLWVLSAWKPRAVPEKTCTISSPNVDVHQLGIYVNVGCCSMTCLPNKYYQSRVDGVSYGINSCLVLHTQRTILQTQRIKLHSWHSCFQSWYISLKCPYFRPYWQLVSVVVCATCTESALESYHRSD